MQSRTVYVDVVFCNVSLADLHPPQNVINKAKLKRTATPCVCVGLSYVMRACNSATCILHAAKCNLRVSFCLFSDFWIVGASAGFRICRRKICICLEAHSFANVLLSDCKILREQEHARCKVQKPCLDPPPPYITPPRGGSICCKHIPEPPCYLCSYGLHNLVQRRMLMQKLIQSLRTGMQAPNRLCASIDVYPESIRPKIPPSALALLPRRSWHRALPCPWLH